MSALKKLLPLWIVFFLAVLLTGCDGEDTPLLEPHQSVEVKSSLGTITVDAYAGGAVHVSIPYDRGSEEQVTLSCTYPGEDGSPRQYTVVDNRPSSFGREIRKEAIDFMLKKPGEYPVECRLGAAASAAKFTVAAPKDPPAANPPANPPANPAGNPAQPKLGPFTSGSMAFAFEKATSSVVNYFYQHCVPGEPLAKGGGTYTFKVSTDGSLSGECSYSQAKNAMRYTGKLTQGQWSADGQVTFTLETSVVVDNVDSATGKIRGTAYSDIVWTGSGKFTGAGAASGTATWKGVCQTSSYDWAPCGKPEYGSHVEATGTIPWTIEFKP